MVKKKKKLDVRVKNIIIYIITVIISVAYILVGREIAMEGYPEMEKASDELMVKVDKIISDDTEEGARQIVFEAVVLHGEMQDEKITVNQTIRDNYYPALEPVGVGDKVLVYANAYTEGTDWNMLEYVRSHWIGYLALAFAAAVILFGRLKGINTLISLAFTCLAVFAVFIPAVLSGQNIYIWAMVTCVYVILMTMLFINGANKKSFAAGAGCFCGVAIAGLLTILMSWVLKLTGMVNEETLYLQLVQTATSIDLKGIIFAAIIIGALGAIMDVAMDIASSLYELRRNVPDISGAKLIGSGFNIGRDVMGTMANTLVLAYIGSGLSTTLLLVAYNISFVELMNMELIVVELLQALVGSIGILLCIPLTAFICAAIYPQRKQDAFV
jgi:uncharacterized membrane protein